MKITEGRLLIFLAFIAIFQFFRTKSSSCLEHHFGRMCTPKHDIWPLAYYPCSLIYLNEVIAWSLVNKNVITMFVKLSETGDLPWFL